MKTERYSRWEALLPRFSLNRRVTVLVLLASTVVIGVVATLGIPLEMFPAGYTEPFLSVRAPWRDAPAPEVLDKVVLPLEEELSTVRGLDRIVSVARTGSGSCYLTFKLGTDMSIAYREVRDRIERAKARLPEDVDRVLIRKHDTSGIPVAVVGVAIDPGLSNTYDLIQNEVVLRLQRIDGVANVEVNGLEEKEILIELDRQRTAASGLNIYQLAQQLGGDNFSLSSGSVIAGDKKLLLRSVARYADVEALRALPVAPNVRLGDIATIKYEEPEKKYRIRVNSMPAVAVEVQKEGDANTLEVSRAVAAEVERIRQNPRLGDTDMAVLMDQGKIIVESLTGLLDNGRVGALLAIAVLFFFLRRVRMTLIITLSIPLSILVALIVMYFAEETLNILSLLGLMICVGLLVDNSVVVAENIYRLHRSGLSRRESCLQGAGEIALAITMATLTTMAVFLPVSLVEGQGQFFLQRLTIPIAVSLAASLLVALVFVPLSVYLTLPQRANGNGHGRFSLAHKKVNRLLGRLYEVTFGRLNDGYSRLLGVALRPWRWLYLAVVLTAFFFTVSALLGSKTVEFQMADEEERGGFEVDVEMPQSNTYEESEAFFDEIEDKLEGIKDELGLDGFYFWHAVTYGEIQGWFETPRVVDVSPRQAAERFLEVLPERPGVKYFVNDEEGEDDDDKTIQSFTIYGDEPEQLETVAEELEPLFSGVEGVLAVRKSGQEPLRELALVVDRNRAQRQQINPTTIAGMVGYALRGQALPKYYADGREIPVRVRFQEQDRESLSQLADFDVPTEQGDFVSLASVTDVRYLPSAKRIVRRNKRLSRTITLELEEGKEKETRARLTAVAAGIDLPEGLSFGAASRRGTDNEDMQAMSLALVLSIAFVFLLMAFLFESFVLPLSIIMTIPLALIGVVWAHFLSGKNIDFLGVIGMVLLVGVVVNNGIVLIDYVNRLRREGIERTAAIVQAAHDRFRPIMMTAMTTICGMIPLTLGGTSSIGMSYKSFGLTLIGGLSSATLLTLLVVPVFYALFDDIRHLSSAAMRSALRLGGPKGSPSSAPSPVREA